MEQEDGDGLAGVWTKSPARLKGTAVSEVTIQLTAGREQTLV
jgi:hypothetical protein